MGACLPIGVSGRNYRLDGKSRMRRESHVRFREGVGVRFPRATQQPMRPQSTRQSVAVWCGDGTKVGGWRSVGLLRGQEGAGARLGDLRQVI